MANEQILISGIENKVRKLIEAFDADSLDIRKDKSIGLTTDGEPFVNKYAFELSPLCLTHNLASTGTSTWA